MNRIIIGAVTVLIFLVFFTLLVTSFINNKSQQQSAGITPIPTQALSDRGGTIENDAFAKDLAEDHFAFSEDEKSKLSRFKERLPYYSSNLEIAYSDELGLFFIQKKSPQGDAELNALLENDNLTQIFEDRSALFIQTDESLSTAIAKTKDTLSQINKEVDDEEIDSSGKAVKTQQQIDTATLGDLSTVLFSFTIPTRPTSTQPAGKGGGTCATGGYPFASRGQQVVGTPGSGTHSWTGKFHNWESCNAVDLRTPVGTPLCAIADGTITRIKRGNPDPSGRSAGISLHLAVNGNEWWYAHLINIAPGINAGTRVRAGQTIGYTGAANNVPHLHLGVRSGNPMSLLGL